MKWVTGYWDMMYGLRDVKLHPDRATATKHFKRHYRDYFDINVPCKFTLPRVYGFMHRKFFGITKTAFEKQFGKAFLNSMKGDEE